jgi:uncharacterized protein (DUF427 family)
MRASREVIAESPTSSVGPWKGTASYLDVEGGGSRNAGAAWYYPDPRATAAEIAGRVAFWKGVEVTD